MLTEIDQNFKFWVQILDQVSILLIIIVKNTIDFRRQNLTSVDVKFYRRQILTANVDPRTVRVKQFMMAVDP